MPGEKLDFIDIYTSDFVRLKSYRKYPDEPLPLVQNRILGELDVLPAKLSKLRLDIEQLQETEDSKTLLKKAKQLEKRVLQDLDVET